MGIIDKDRRIVAAPDKFEAPGRPFEVFERRENPFGRPLRRQRKSGGDERILRLKFAGKWQPQTVGLAGAFDNEARRKIFRRCFNKPQYIACFTYRNDRKPARRAGRDDRLGDRAIGIDHRRLAGREQTRKEAQFGGEIGVHVGMII
jgi:hypothetical protein